MAPTAIDCIGNVQHNAGIVVDERVAISDSYYESKKLDTKQPLLVNIVEPASPLDSEQPSSPNGGQTSPVLEGTGTTAAPVLEASRTEAPEMLTTTEVSAAIEKDIPVVDNGAVQVSQETIIPTIVDLEAPAIIEAVAAPIIAPSIQAPSIRVHMATGTKLPASTRLQKMIKETNELIVCPGVYDGLSARTAIEVGFDSLYMV